VFLPTYASWLNWIECKFTALRYFALNGTDHRTYTEQRQTFTSRCGGVYGLWVIQSISAGQWCAQSGGSVSL